MLPVRNHAREICGALEKIHEHLSRRPSGTWEILVVTDDGDDETSLAVTAFARGHGHVLLLRNPAALGCGYAVRHGVLLTQGERILLVGPGLPAPIALLDGMEQLIEQGHDLVVASHRTAITRPLPPVRMRGEIAARSVGAPLRLLARRRAMRHPLLFQLYTRRAAMEIFRRQRLDGPSFAIEIFYLARRFGYSVIEMGVPGGAASEAIADAWSDPGKGLSELVRIRMHRLRGDYG